MSKNNKKDSVKKTNVNKARIEAKIMCFTENGREEITTKKQLEKYKIGSLVSYTNTANVFKMGGFITKFADEYFIYVTPDFTTKYRVRYVNIKKMWVGDVYRVKNDLISLTETIQKKTNFEIKINDVVIFYARNSFDVKRFKSTDKYKRLVAWNEYFNND
jgi:hypothetical protein